MTEPTHVGHEIPLRSAEAADGLPLRSFGLRERRRAGTWPRVSVIIPTLNEERNLPLVLGAMPEVHEVIIVDGRSTDGTVAVARAHMPECRIVMQRGEGKGDALMAGFEAATGDIIVTLDADGSLRPQEIPLFVGALMSGAHFVKGSRALAGGGSDDLTRLRGAGNRGLGVLVNVLFGTRFTDLCYGYNAFWRACLEHIDVRCDGFEIETLMIVQAAKANLRIAEVPSFEKARVHGESNLRTFRDGFRVLRTIVTQRRTPPILAPTLESLEQAIHSA